MESIQTNLVINLKIIVGAGLTVRLAALVLSVIDPRSSFGLHNSDRLILVGGEPK